MPTDIYCRYIFISFAPISLNFPTDPQPMTCPICFETVQQLHPWGDPLICTHELCPLCTVRQLRLELGHPESTRVNCAVPGCGAPISSATLAVAAAWTRPACSAPQDDLDLRPLAREVVAMADSRRLAAEMSNRMASMRAALPGMEVHPCPFPPCTAILTGEATKVLPGEMGHGSDPGLGRLAYCSACGGQVCSVCCQAWELPAGGNPPGGHRGQTSLSHRGKGCTATRQARGTAGAAVALGMSSVVQSGRNPVSSRQLGCDSAAFGDLLGSVKQCPTCGVGVSHYRGHACHHIGTGRGCRGCIDAGYARPAHWCYVCLGPWPCLNSSANGCNTYCDETCDCPDCPDCAPGKPCANCSGVQGGCRVCSGEAGKGHKTQALWESRCRAARAAKMSTGWKVRL